MINTKTTSDTDSRILSISVKNGQKLIELENNLTAFRSVQLKHLVPQLMQDEVPIIVEVGSVEILDLLTINKLRSFELLGSKFDCDLKINANPDTPAFRQLEQAGVEVSAIKQMFENLN